MLSGLSIGISNAIARRDKRVDARELITFYPRESATLILASSRLKRFFPMLCLDGVLRQFHNAVAGAKAETMALAAIGFELPVDPSNDEAPLAAAWKHASIASLALIAALHETIACLGFAGSADEDTLLREFINSAIAGRYSLNENGSIEMPAGRNAGNPAAYRFIARQRSSIKGKNRLSRYEIFRPLVSAWKADRISTPPTPFLSS